MKQRGRKSSAELSIVAVGLEALRPDPPGDLTPAQADIWRATVADVPGGWITVGQEPLLAAYCRHVDAGNSISAQVNKLNFNTVDLKHLNRLLAMRLRETSATMSLATKMRLTQQSRMHARTAGRAADTPSTPRPWEFP